MGRKKLDKEQKKVHNTFTQDYDLQEIMDKYLEDNKVQKSHFIENLVREFFNKNKQNNKFSL